MIQIEAFDEPISVAAKICTAQKIEFTDQAVVDQKNGVILHPANMEMKHRFSLKELEEIAIYINKFVEEERKEKELTEKPKDIVATRR